jgi:5'-nucleotidase
MWLSPASRFFCVVLFASVLGCATPQNEKSGFSTPTRLTILAINDFHGQLSPLVWRTRETPPRKLRIGGAEALAATIAELRSKRPSATLLLDAGDFMQGSLVSNSFEGDPVRDLFSLLAIDATVIGNHEFDFGPRGPGVTAKAGQDARGALRYWLSKAPFPVLSANIADHSGQLVQWKNLAPTLMLERAGIKIGIIGLTTTDTPSTTLFANVADLRFLPLVPIVRARAHELRKKGAQAVIVVAHVGGVCRTRDPKSCKGEIFNLVRRLKPGVVDAVIAGHSHRCLWHRVNSTPVVQACSRSMAVGRIELTFRGGKLSPRESHALAPVPVCHDVFADGRCEADLKQGKWTTKLRLNPLLQKHAKLVSKVSAGLSPYRKKMKKQAARVLATAARPIVHRYRGRSEVGVMFARMLKAAIPGADVGIINAGGVRGSFNAGAITFGQLYRVFPFDNKLATVKLSGAQLEKMLSDSLSRRHSGILQPADLQISVQCRPKVKLVSVTKNGKPLDPKRLYTVVISDFVLAGGDGTKAVLAKVPADRKRIYNDILIRDAMARYLAGHKKPINRTEAPVLSAKAPAVTIVGPACEARKRSGRPICR